MDDLQWDESQASRVIYVHLKKSGKGGINQETLEVLQKITAHMGKFVNTSISYVMILWILILYCEDGCLVC